MSAFLRCPALPVAALPVADLLVIPALLAIMIIVSIADLLSGGHLHDTLGIQPRTLQGLPGLVCAPFLHLSYSHLAANMVPLAVLSVMLLLRLTAAQHSPAWRPFLGLCAFMALTANIAVWLLARPNSDHAGASGLVFSLAGLLLAAGVVATFEMGWPPRCSSHAALSMACTLITFVTHGGLLWGLSPTTWVTQWSVSWEGHTAGFLTGVLAAWLLLRHEQGRLPAWTSRVLFGSAVPPPAAALPLAMPAGANGGRGTASYGTIH